MRVATRVCICMTHPSGDLPRAPTLNTLVFASTFCLTGFRDPVNSSDNSPTRSWRCSLDELSKVVERPREARSCSISGGRGRGDEKVVVNGAVGVQEGGRWSIRSGGSVCD